ncbi:Putative fatty acyl-CoA reductase CG5065, partial [Eumeta japonica]
MHVFTIVCAKRHRDAKPDSPTESNKSAGSTTTRAVQKRLMCISNSLKRASVVHYAFSGSHRDEPGAVIVLGIILARRLLSSEPKTRVKWLRHRQYLVGTENELSIPGCVTYYFALKSCTESRINLIEVNQIDEKVGSFNMVSNINFKADCRISSIGKTSRLSHKASLSRCHLRRSEVKANGPVDNALGRSVILGVQKGYRVFVSSIKQTIFVSNKYPELPVFKVRPSIVSPSYAEPMPGWVDTLNGPMGIMTGAAKGVIRTMLCNGSYFAQIVPVDVAINGIICATYKEATRKESILEHPDPFPNAIVTWRGVYDIPHDRDVEQSLLNCHYDNTLGTPKCDASQ